MTEQAAETPVKAPESHGEPQTGAPEGKGTGEAPKPNREAAYRVARNEARAERDAALARVEALQAREVERLAGDLAQPGDLLALGGVEMSDLIGEDGFVDSEAVAEAVAKLIESRPGLSKNVRVPAYDPTQGMGAPGKGKLDWADLFKQ